VPAARLDLRRLDANLLVACDVLLTEQSVTRAARRLFVTQPAMSQTLGRLRELFADPLLVRQGSKMVLTPLALGLAAPLKKALADLQSALERRPSFEPARATKGFVVATTDYVGAVLFPALVRLCRREAPGVDLEVRWVEVARYAEALERGEYDLAVTALGPEAGCGREELFRDRYACLVREGHPLTRRPDLATFAASPHALMSPRGGGPGIVDEALARLDRRRRVMVRAPSFALGASMLRESDLIMTVPRRLARLYAGAGLAAVDPPVELPDLTIAQAWHLRNEADAASRWLRGAVARAAKRLRRG
jgi:DNA-binding transcriptional LysR family regulator